MTTSLKAGLIGHGIAGSMTPEMHEAEGRAQGLNYGYRRIDTATPPFEGKALSWLLDYAEDEGFAGVNITHPFKRQVVTFADEMSETVSSMGAANTLLFQNGKRAVHNTDYIGYRSALRHTLQLGSIGKVLLLGAGGAGGAVALALIDQGCRSLLIYDPASDRAETLVKMLRSVRPTAIVSVQRDLADIETFDGVVNATPLGMASHPGMAIDPALLARRAWVSDIVYFPLETQLLRESRARDLVTMSGASMAVYQAVAAFSLITGRKADPSRMTAVFEEITGISRKPVSKPKMTVV